MWGEHLVHGGENIVAYEVVKVLAVWWWYNQQNGFHWHQERVEYWPTACPPFQLVAQAIAEHWALALGPRQ
ncbi:hypothetical protein B1H26_24440 [Amycolatopsis sp. BJA-103]|nr:hypothetical protein BKN51_20815 [Amycolatopsis sp. BJA-103]PNE16420.1 hypothetical protein B1H26_24440 [Amycolatopsis sp. BJA-103]